MSLLKRKKEFPFNSPQQKLGGPVAGSICMVREFELHHSFLVVAFPSLRFVFRQEPRKNLIKLESSKIRDLTQEMCILMAREGKVLTNLKITNKGADQI